MTTATRVMVVEDERIVALNLKQRLSKLGYEISALATSGKQALEEIARQPPDIVLMDINIEGDIDGIETASRIPGAAHIPVIYLTAYSEEATLERARSTKPYGFLLKPFSERELHATIQMVLERRRADVLIRENEQRLETLVQERTADLKREVADRLRAEEALRQSQKMEAIGQLTGGIAHDFNNLLQSILSSLTLIQRCRERGREADVDRHIAMARDASNRAAALIHSLLAFSRRQPLDPRPVNANDLLRSVLGMLRQVVGEAITVEVFLADGLRLTHCDANQLESAILNAAVNARDAMPEGGKLTVETRNMDIDAALSQQWKIKAGPFVCISISDTGVGMTPEVVAHAFEPFFTTKPLGRGTGLGLSMLYGFARQSEGWAKIYSEVGRGTTVTLYLPEYRGVDQPSRPDASVPKTATPVPPGSVVLVVEDETTVRGQMVEVLRDLGYVVLEAEDGPAGLQILRSDARIDLLATDIGLPGLNGRQVADAGRVLRPGLKVLFMTGYAENATMAGGFLEPGMRLMSKPFTLDALATRVKEAIDG